MDQLLHLDDYGEDFAKYFRKSERLLRYLGTFYDYDGQDRFLIPQLKRNSIIHINFEEAEVMTVTKDAKITLPDMIGNVGGTLGVFIGFSFLGLFDTLVEWLQYLRSKMASLKAKIG